tara:strand:- start:19 stop:750 length:732 start_codon:yes stop_codon:yes gene_type:complete
MELKSLNQIPNQYPETRDITESYILNSESGGISYYGKFRENKVDFEKIAFEDVRIVDETNFQFIVKFKDGTLFTSPSFHKKIEDIRKDSTNPYITTNSLPIILFDDSLLQNYATKEEFKVGEDYAEVVVNDTLNTKEDYLKHIDYLTTPDSGNSPIKQASEMGRWTVEMTDDLGITHQPELDALEAVEDNFAQTQPPVEVVNPPPANTSSTSVFHEQVNNIEINKPPTINIGGFRRKGIIQKG